MIIIISTEHQQACTHVDHNQLDDPLPFNIIYTNIVLVLKSQSACVTTQKNTILVYIILNDKGDSLVSTGQSNIP